MADPIAKAMMEMMRTRRSSSRCSMIVMRRSSSVTTRLGFAIHPPLGREGRVSGLGFAGRLRVGCRPVGLVGLGRGRAAFDLVLQVRRGLAELAHRLADGSADFWKLAGTVDDQDDHEQDHQDVPVAEKTHSVRSLGLIIRSHFWSALKDR